MTIFFTASEKKKYQQQSGMTTQEESSASPKRLVNKHHSVSKKKAPDIPNSERTHQSVGHTQRGLDTSVQSDTHQLIASRGEEHVKTDSTEQSE